MIPKIIHYVWVGPKPLPDEDRRRAESWRDMLPGWEFKLWGNDDVDFGSSYLRQAFSVRAWNRVSDYVRMDALAKFGGVYLDTDVELFRDLSPLLQERAFLGFQAGNELPDQMVNGAIFGAEQGHWLPTEIRRHFNEDMDGRVDVKAFSGPGLLTQVLRGKGLDTYSDSPVIVDGVKIFPKRYFYPYSWDEEFSPQVVTNDTYAVHYWAHTWGGKKKIADKVRVKAINWLSWNFPSAALNAARSAVRAK